MLHGARQRRYHPAIVATRRAVLSSFSALAAMGIAPLHSRSPFINLSYAAGRLMWPGGNVEAACGRNGVRRDKREGDGATPAGVFPLLSAFYRPDRMLPPPTGLRLAPLRPDDLWVD